MTILKLFDARNDLNFVILDFTKMYVACIIYIVGIYVSRSRSVAEPLVALGVPWYPQSFFFKKKKIAIFLHKFHTALPKKRKKKKFFSHI
jgi:hypothetical protein